MQSFAALADPTRRQIVELLAKGDLPSGEIAAQFELSAPAVSQHLKVLREAHLVRVSIDAQRRIYALDLSGLADIEAWLSRVRQAWAGRLEALERQLATQQEQARKTKR